MLREGPFVVEALIAPSEADVERVTDILAACFMKDKFVHIVTANDPALYAPFFKSQVIAAVIDGVIYVAKKPDGTWVGAAVWFGPGQEMFWSERQSKEAWEPFEKMFSPQLKSWWDDVLTPIDDAFVLKSFGPGTKLRGWHLQVIGVLPEYRQQGIASRIIDTVKQIATQAHLPMTLEVETEFNVHVYESMGFKLKHQVDGCGPWGNFTMYGLSLLQTET